MSLGTDTVTILVSLVAQVCELLFFFQLYCILIKTKKPESSFLELSDFFTVDTYRASRDTLLATVPVIMAYSNSKDSHSSKVY